MLQQVDVGAQSVDAYRRSAGDDAVDALRELGRSLRGARVLHLNATPYGGGVAELLRSEIPLLRDLGLAADWKLITGAEPFFEVTKAIHNGLQGAPRALTSREFETYLTSSTVGGRNGSPGSRSSQDRDLRPWPAPTTSVRLGSGRNPRGEE